MKVEANDRQLLKQLTTTTLFCPHCYRPFLEKVGNEDVGDLSTAYAAMMDYLSAIMFVLVPLAWIPLILLFAVMALKEWISDLFSADDDGRKQDHTDFDREVKIRCTFHILRLIVCAL